MHRMGLAWTVECHLVGITPPTNTMKGFWRRQVVMGLWQRKQEIWVFWGLKTKQKNHLTSQVRFPHMILL